MSLKAILFCVLWYLLIIDRCNPISYVITERPVVTYVNEVFFKYLILTNRRRSRQDPRYYLNVNCQTLIYLTNKMRMDFYFYQLLTNGNRPSFVEIHLGFCDLIEKDVIFGSQLKRNLANLTCPYPPGQYNLTDMAIPSVPKNFPFQRGRIYLNISYHENRNLTLAASGYIDMEIKNIVLKKKM